jgi:hypothetical protein
MDDEIKSEHQFRPGRLPLKIKGFTNYTVVKKFESPLPPPRAHPGSGGFGDHSSWAPTDFQNSYYQRRALNAESKSKRRTDAAGEAVNLLKTRENLEM